jgi:hypothetical protein
MKDKLLKLVATKKSLVIFVVIVILLFLGKWLAL